LSGDERLSGANVDFYPVLRADPHSTRDHVTNVLVRLLSGERLNVLRPPPAWSVEASADRDVSELDCDSFALVEKRPFGVGRVETLRRDL
jgi:hypothetical protein